MFINYKELPGFRELYLDYLYNFENLKNIYKLNFRDTESFTSKFQEIASSERLHRKLLPDIIGNQYDGLKKSKIVESNIELLGSTKTMAIVTGQQLGIFGGPLYTIYKVITAIKLSRQLKEKFENFNFVPVFWLEGDDHDFEEVKSINILDKTNNFKTITYNDGIDDDKNRGNVGKILFNEKINDFINEFSDSLRDNEFKEELLKSLKEYYKTGNNFSFAFRQLLNDLFGDYGLVIFNPQDARVKKLLRPVFKKELDNFRKHLDSAIERSAYLEETYHAQVKVKPINLFLTENNERFSLEPEDGLFRLRNRRIKYSLEEMHQKLETNPEDFSPNVLLRPICQDFILPTAFYVGGPAEIAYFAQVIPNYSFFNVPQPILFPRASATILEKNIKTLLEKYSLAVPDVFGDEKDLSMKVLNMLSDVDVEEIFSNSVSQIERLFDDLKEKFFAIDPTLVENSIRSKEKVLQTFEVMKSKVEKAAERNNETVIRQLEKLRINLYPDDNYQERVFNHTTFAIKYGSDIVNWLFNELNINKFEHQIMEI